jgi:glucose-6-phosphate-specific signal transduction histidine kinase
VVEESWLALNQLTGCEGQHTRRPDVVLYVNGLHLGCNGSAGGGIEGMRQRLAAVGGRLEIAAEVGTRVRAWLPLEKAAP